MIFPISPLAEGREQLTHTPFTFCACLMPSIIRAQERGGECVSPFERLIYMEKKRAFREIRQGDLCERAFLGCGQKLRV